MTSDEESQAERMARSLAGEAVECSTYKDKLCACRGGLYPGSVQTCTRRREHERALRASRTDS